MSGGASSISAGNGSAFSSTVTEESSNLSKAGSLVQKSFVDANGHTISFLSTAVQAFQRKILQAAYHAARAFFPSLVQFGAMAMRPTGLINEAVISTRGHMITHLYQGNDKIAVLLDLKIKALKGGETDLATAYDKAIAAFSEGKEQLGDIYKKAADATARKDEKLIGLYKKAATALEEGKIDLGHIYKKAATAFEETGIMDVVHVYEKLADATARKDEKLIGLYQKAATALERGSVNLGNVYEKLANATARKDEKLIGLYQKAATALETGSVDLGNVYGKLADATARKDEKLIGLYQKAASALEKHFEIKKRSIDAIEYKKLFEELLSHEYRERLPDEIIKSADDGAFACDQEIDACAKAADFQQRAYHARMEQAGALEGKNFTEAERIEKTANTYEENAATLEQGANLYFARQQSAGNSIIATIKKIVPQS
ncbi:MAG: hypothetical protein ACOYK6_03985 [Chthoniobacterales bacterium]